MRAAISAGVIYFALVFAVGFVLGTVRMLLLAPRLGALPSVAVELPLMLAASWLACIWTLRTVAVSPRTGPRLAMGASAFALLMAAEAALSMLLGQTLAQHLASYNGAPQRLGLAGQLLFALFPLLQARSHRARAE